MIYVCCFCGAKLQQPVRVYCDAWHGKAEHEHHLCGHCWKWWEKEMPDDKSVLCPSRKEDLIVMKMMR